MSKFEIITSEAIEKFANGTKVSFKNELVFLKTLDEANLPNNVNQVVLESEKQLDLVVILRTKNHEITYIVKPFTKGRIVFYFEEETVNAKRLVILEDNTEITFVCPDFNQAGRNLEIETRLIGVNSKADWNLATFSSKRHEKIFNISFSHYGAKSTANMKNYGVILDESKLVFSGISTIFEDVKGCETHQTARIIVFDQGGVAEANPNLNIYHNDVIAASHAATVGKINADHLYYLNTRGIDELNAKRLITKGYLQPIINYIEDDALKTKLLNQLEGVL